MLPRRHRLTTEAFERLKKRGRMLPGAGFGILFLVRKDDGFSRFGFIVSGKISGLAHERNKIKRLLSEAIAPLVPEVKNGYDLLFLAKKDIAGKSLEILKIEIKDRMTKNGLLK